MSGSFSIRHLDVRTEFPAPELTPVDIPEDAWRNGMVVRMPNHLGDTIMALPALEALKKRLPPDMALYVIAPEYLRKLFATLPCIDGVIGLVQPHRRWRRREFNALRCKRFGVGVMFNRSFRDAFFMRLAGVRYLYGIPGSGLRNLFLKRRLSPLRKGEPPGHMTQQYLAVAAALGAPRWDGALPHFVPMGVLNEMSASLRALCEHPQVLILCPGAAYGSAKRWSEEGFREIADRWIRRGGVVAVAGGKNERATGDRAINGLDPDKAFNLCGDTALDELFRLLESALVIVANDSGLMHLSAAAGCRGVTVFGPTDYTATGPISPEWSLLSDPPPCAPCFRHECPRNHECMTSVTPDQVWAEIETILAARHVKLPPPRK